MKEHHGEAFVMELNSSLYESFRNKARWGVRRKSFVRNDPYLTDRWTSYVAARKIRGPARSLVGTMMWRDCCKYQRRIL